MPALALASLALSLINADNHDEPDDELDDETNDELDHIVCFGNLISSFLTCEV